MGLWMRSLAIIGCVALAGAASASAQCPTRADLEGGATVYVAYPDEGTVELRWLGAGMVQETTRYPDGEGEFRMISMGGVFIIDEVDLDGDSEIEDSRITSRFPPGLYDRLPVQPGTEMSLTAVNTFADDTAPEEEHIELRAGGIDTIDIAGCRYSGFPMLITYSWDEEYFTSMMIHLPDLGLSVEVARMDPDSGAIPFAPQAFSLERP